MIGNGYYLLGLTPNNLKITAIIIVMAYNEENNYEFSKKKLLLGGGKFKTP